MRSFVKIKFPRIGEITLPFTDIGISRPCHELSTPQRCVLTLFAKIELSPIFPNLQYLFLPNPFRPLLIVSMSREGTCGSANMHRNNKATVRIDKV